MSARLLGTKQRFNKERFQLAENLQSARCSPFVISKVLAARLRKSITARARKNNRTARMLANARKNHAIPLTVPLFAETKGKWGETFNKQVSDVLCEKPIILLELLFELRIVVIQNSEDGKRTACKKCAWKIVNCYKMFAELQEALACDKDKRLTSSAPGHKRLVCFAGCRLQVAGCRLQVEI